MTAIRPRLKGQARTAVLFLLFGVITTALIGWMFALFGSTPYSNSPRGSSGGVFASDEQTLQWPVGVPANWSTPRTLEQRRGRGLNVDIATTGIKDDPGVETRPRWKQRIHLISVRSGWPMRALYMRTVSIQDGDQPSRVTRTPVLKLPQWLEHFVDANSEDLPVKRALPLLPEWPGFLVDTLAYALLFWAALRLPGALRSVVRHRRRQCVTCGYPIGESPLCSECGAPVRTQAILASATPRD